MKHFTLVLAAVFALFATGCADDMVANNQTYTSYGLINEDEVKDPNIVYKPCVGNIVWGIILFETVVAPIYFFGYSMYEPIAVKPKTEPLPSQ